MKRLFLLLTFCCLFVTCNKPEIHKEPEEPGSITSLSGEVTLIRDNKEKIISIKDIIQQNDTIKTSFFSNTNICFGNIDILLHQMTYITFETINYGDFLYLTAYLESGEITITIHDDKASILIDTQINTVFTRNGAFVINAKGQIEVIEGEIAKSDKILRSVIETENGKKIKHSLPDTFIIIKKDQNLYKGKENG